MIRLPDGTEKASGALGQLVTIGDVQIPERDLFKRDVMRQFGIKEVVRTEETVDNRFYRVSGLNESEEVVDGIAVVTVTPTVERRFTVTQLAKQIGDLVEKAIRNLYRLHKVYYDELIDPDSPVYDLSNDFVAAFEGYRAELKTAYQAIKADILDIRDSGETNDVKYSQILAYNWFSKLPTEPGDAVE